jgi:hypothetical protein
MWPVAPALAAGIVLYLAGVSEIGRVDRIVLWGVLSTAYTGAILVLAALASGLRRISRWSRALPAADIGAGVFLGLHGVNLLLGHFGYKFILTEDRPLLSSLPLPVEIALLLLALLLPLLAVRGLRWLPRPSFPTGLAIALLMGLSCLLPSSPRDRFSGLETVAADLPRPAARNPVIVVALDGLDRQLLASVMARVALPVFEDLAEGFDGHLDNGNYGFSPVVWASFATGLREGGHRMHDFAVRSSPFFADAIDSWWMRIPPNLGVRGTLGLLESIGPIDERLADGRDRIGPSIWQVASLMGLRTLVVGMLQSFPAENVSGVFVSDHAYDWVLSDDFEGKPRAGYDYPPGFLTQLAAAGPPWPIEPVEPSPGSRLEFSRAVAEAALAAEDFDLVTVYSKWPDLFNHAFTADEYVRMRSGDLSSARARAYVEMCERLDLLLLALRELLPSANIIVVSDHGVGTGYRLKQRVVQHHLACPGAILANGPDVRAGSGAGVEAIDFVPTLLSYFGLPLAEDLVGEPVPDLLAPAATRPERIFSWRRYVRNSRVPTPAEAEPIGQREQLRGLGYIQ